jgi:hypothetical protein
MATAAGPKILIGTLLIFGRVLGAKMCFPIFPGREKK